jgi:hypothetical protein
MQYMSTTFKESNRSLVIDCMFAFAASAFVTLIVCAAAPVRPIPAHYLRARRNEALDPAYTDCCDGTVLLNTGT